METTHRELRFKPIGAGMPLAPYSKRLARAMHWKDIRRNGKTAFHDHLLPIAEETAKLIRPESGLKEIAEAAGYLHDAGEDKRQSIGSLNPFAPEQRKPGIAYLNDLFADAGEAGKGVCYIANRVTRLKDGPKKLYYSYIEDLFTLPAIGSEERPFAIVAMLLKIVDTGKNTNPDEIEWLWNRHVESLIKNGCDSSEFKTEAIKYEEGIDRINGNALNNITNILPKAEYVLLGHVKNGEGVFEPGAVENYLRMLYIQGYVLTGLTPSMVARAGLNRDHDDKMAEFGKQPIICSLGEDLEKAIEIFPSNVRARMMKGMFERMPERR